MWKNTLSQLPELEPNRSWSQRAPNSAAEATEASRSLSPFAQSPDGEAGQVAMLCISVTVSIPGRPSGGVAGYFELCVERPFFAVYGDEGKPPVCAHGQCGPVAISSLFRAFVNQH